MKYIVSGLIAALLCVLILYKCERDTRVTAEKDLAVAMEVNAANQEAIATFEQYQINTEKALQAFLEDKTDLDKLRTSLTNSIQQLIISNEDFKAWASMRLPFDAIRVYNEAAGTVSSDRP